MKKMWKVVAVVAVVALMASCLVACSGKDDSKLIMATNAEFPPFEYVTEKGLLGEFDGIDVAIAMEVASKMGKQLEISNMVFDSIIPSVVSGKADIGVAGMTVKPERLEQVDFSDTYWVAMQTIVVPENNTDITNVDALVGKTVGVVTGYTGDMAVSEVEGIKVNRYQKGADAIVDLKNGKVDAVVIDAPTAENFIKRNPELKGVSDDEFFGKEEYAIAVQKGNDDLLKAINATLAELKESGRLDEIAAEVAERLANE